MLTSLNASSTRSMIQYLSVRVLANCIIGVNQGRDGEGGGGMTGGRGKARRTREGEGGSWQEPRRPPLAVLRSFWFLGYTRKQSQHLIMHVDS